MSPVCHPTEEEYDYWKSVWEGMGYSEGDYIPYSIRVNQDYPENTYLYWVQLGRPSEFHIHPDECCEWMINRMCSRYSSDELVSVWREACQPNIECTGISVHPDLDSALDGTNEITSWREDKVIYIRVNFRNTGKKTGKVTFSLSYDTTEIGTFTSIMPVAPGGVTYEIRWFEGGTIPAGSWNLCAKIVSQEEA